MKEAFVICSDCFQRYGIKLMAERYGVKDGQPCPQCGSFLGAKLTRDKARELAVDYIVKGSYYRSTFGGAPVYMISDVGHDDKLFDADPDLILLQNKCSLSAFLYAPATWRVGITTWLDNLLDENSATTKKTVLKLIDECEKTVCIEGTLLFRLLSQVFGNSADPLTYDAPHWSYQKEGRFGLDNISVLYLSSSIESAIHECRVTIEDDLHLASVKVKKPLRIVDLTKTLNDSGDPWEDLSTSLWFICSTGKDAYPITRAIAQEVFNQGYDGIFYWSYFNRVSYEKGKNLVLFGSPIKEGKVEVISIDRLLLDNIQYSYSLGVLI